MNIIKKTYLLFILLSLTLNGQTKVSKGKLNSGKIAFQYGIYTLNKEKIDFSVIKSQIKNINKNLIINDSLPKDTDNRTQVNIYEVKGETSPPDLETLKYFGRGLTEDQKTSIQDAKQLILLTFFCNENDNTQTLQAANKIILSLTQNKNVVLSDSDTREFFSRDYWDKYRQVDVNSVFVKNLITIHFYQNEKGLCRAVTLGMSKFGLPDINANDLPCSDSEHISNLINLTAQTLFENQSIEAEGKLALNIDALKNAPLKEYLLNAIYKEAQKKATIDIILGKPEEGDPENRLIEINFPEKDKQVHQNKLFLALFGNFDKIQFVKHNDLIEKESQNAKLKIPALFKKFKTGLPVNSSLYMKYHFTDNEGNSEYMWLEIIKWDTIETITGILSSTPYFLKNIKSGQKITKSTADMFDYILYNADGTQEGNETGKLLEKYKEN